MAKVVLLIATLTIIIRQHEVDGGDVANNDGQKQLGNNYTEHTNSSAERLDFVTHNNPPQSNNESYQTATATNNLDVVRSSGKVFEINYNAAEERVGLNVGNYLSGNRIFRNQTNGSGTFLRSQGERSLSGVVPENGPFVQNVINNVSRFPLANEHDNEHNETSALDLRNLTEGNRKNWTEESGSINISGQFKEPDANAITGAKLLDEKGSVDPDGRKKSDERKSPMIKRSRFVTSSEIEESNKTNDQILVNDGSNLHLQRNSNTKPANQNYNLSSVRQQQDYTVMKNRSSALEINGRYETTAAPSTDVVGETRSGRNGAKLALLLPHEAGIHEVFIEGGLQDPNGNKTTGRGSLKSTAGNIGEAEAKGKVYGQICANCTKPNNGRANGKVYGTETVYRQPKPERNVSSLMLIIKEHVHNNSSSAKRREEPTTVRPENEYSVYGNENEYVPTSTATGDEEIYGDFTTYFANESFYENGSSVGAARIIQEVPWPVKKEAVVEGDIVLGGLMMVHEREDTITCGPVMPQGGIQALEAMLYTLDRLNDSPTPLLPNITLGAHILDDCDKDTYGLEMAVDFIKAFLSVMYVYINQKQIQLETGDGLK